MNQFGMNPGPTRENDTILVRSKARRDEGELWCSFRSGSREALNTIFERYARLLYAYGRSITRDQALVSDCIQDVFVQLWIKRETVAPQVEAIQYYLFRSLRRRISRSLATERKFSQDLISKEHISFEPNAEASLIVEQTLKDRSLRIKNSIDTLSERQREAVYLRFYGNMSYEEIASIMDTDVKAIYNLIARSIHTLRKFFDLHPIEC